MAHLGLPTTAGFGMVISFIFFKGVGMNIPIPLDTDCLVDKSFVYGG